MKVFVNIYNKGKILGIKIPVYNYPMEESIVKLLKEMGMRIEIVDPKKKKQEEMTAAVKKEQEKVVKKIVVNPTVKKEEPVVEVWQAKDVYTEEELLPLTKLELKKILNYRGHYSNKTGVRDRLAPKFDDNKTTLIQKVLETNKN